MAVAFAVDEDSDHGEVSHVVVLVVPLLGSPTEDVESEIGVRLCSQGLVDLDWGKPRFEILNPCLELLLKRCSGSGWVWRNWVLGLLLRG